MMKDRDHFTSGKQSKDKMTMITTKIDVPIEYQTLFADWQAKLHALIASNPGFVSLEIQSPNLPKSPLWIIIQRFSDSGKALAWKESKDRKALFDELREFLGNGKNVIQEVDLEEYNPQAGVTEVLVTQVTPGKEHLYREWIAKIHQVEAKFPGFRCVYVQSPSQGRNWITLLQFDTPENLDRWLNSSERREVLKESESLIESFERHRVISPYAGWFASLAKNGELPPAWKQTMIVLLVLFPIVMLELKYLSPWIGSLNRSLGTFMGNAISVTLVSWPMSPIAIYFLGWWLSPDIQKRQKATIVGTFIIIILYLIEIAAFWYLL